MRTSAQASVEPREKVPRSKRATPRRCARSWRRDVPASALTAPLQGPGSYRSLLPSSSSPLGACDQKSAAVNHEQFVTNLRYRVRKIGLFYFQLDMVVTDKAMKARIRVQLPVICDAFRRLSCCDAEAMPECLCPNIALKNQERVQRAQYDDRQHKQGCCLSSR